MTWLNSVQLVGRIEEEPTELAWQRGGKKEVPPGEPVNIITVAMFPLYIWQPFKDSERAHVRIRVKMMGRVALRFLKLEPKKGDFILVVGRLISRRFRGWDGRFRRTIMVSVDRFQCLWPPPGRFLRGHVVMKAEEAKRLRAISGAYPEWLPIPGIDDGDAPDEGEWIDDSGEDAHDDQPDDGSEDDPAGSQPAE